MIIIGKEKDYIEFFLLSINVISLAVALYCLHLYVIQGGGGSGERKNGSQSIPRVQMFRNITVILLVFFHIFGTILVFADCLMKWVIPTKKFTGFMVSKMITVTSVALIEMILLSMLLYLTHTIPNFVQTHLGSTTNFLLRQGLATLRYGFCLITVLTVITYCALNDKPLVACLVVRLEMSCLLAYNVVHSIMVHRNLRIFVKECLVSKREHLDQSKVDALVKFEKVLLFGSFNLLAAPVIQVTETILYWNSYYSVYSYEGEYSGVDLFPLLFIAPFLAIVICPIFLAQTSQKTKKKTHIDSCNAAGHQDTWKMTRSVDIASPSKIDDNGKDGTMDGTKDTPSILAKEAMSSWMKKTQIGLD